MLDLKFIRENAELIKQAIKNKNEKADIDALLKLDAEKREIQFKFETLRAEQNRVSKEIPKLKKEKKDVSEIMASMGKIAVEIKQLSAQLSDAAAALDDLILAIPNIPGTDVPVGKDENDNPEVKIWGKKKEFDFIPKEHLDLAEVRGLLDMKRATKLAGSGFAGYIGNGALLERALINFMLDFHVHKHGYTEVSLPFIANRKTMTGTGQLPKMEDDMYHITEDDLFLIPTAEVPVTNFHSGEIMAGKDLPEKLISYSPCFRREAGSYGKDTKGLQRLHQFNKVEMVRFVRPENSNAVLNEMVQDAEDILQALGLHYRVIVLCTGDMSFASAKTYDLEVWAPGVGRYLEVSSVSNFVDFQARRAAIRFRDNDEKVKFVHTLNGSGLATPRTFIAVVETYQNEDGSITVPEVLRPYLGGKKII